MQPCNAELEKIKFPALAQQKIDGMKLVIKIKQGTIEVLSRSMKPIVNEWLVDQVTGMFRPVDFLMNTTIEVEAQNGGLFTASKGLVSAKYREFGDLKLHVFDAIPGLVDLPYRKRHAVSSEIVNTIEDPRVVLVDSIKVHNHQELRDVCEVNSNNPSLDGTIVRQAESPYKAGKRTTTEGFVVKIKNQDDMEVIITGFAELMHNENEGRTNELGRTARSTSKEGLVPGNTLGAFICQTADGKEVRVGSLEGVTKPERQKFWNQRDKLMGQLIKITYMSLSEYSVPLHPVFVGFRSPLDLDAE